MAKKTKQYKPEYRVLIDYSTGSSFHNEDIYGQDLGLVWHDADKAYKAATLVKEHAALSDDLDEVSSYRPRPTKKEVLKKACKTEWYKNAVKKRGKHPKNEFEILYYFGVETDNGEIAMIRPFWEGYFEQLHEVRVESKV